MIANERPVIADSLWTATASEPGLRPRLRETIRTDVAVIGAGYTGLSAALHLAEAGAGVAVVEAQQPGWGASGRNGGQINPGLKEGPAAIIARFGPDMGARMIALSGGAGDLVFDLIARHKIDCDAVRPGWVRAAHNPKTLAELHALAAEWQARGAPVDPLDRAELEGMTGAQGYLGGLIDRRGGNLHPLNYALGLAGAAERHGARIFGESPATGLMREGAGWRVTTPEGEVDADRVLICTNAYSGLLHPGLARSVVPIRSVQVATAPLSDNLRGTVLPHRNAVSDMARLLLYFRVDAQGRFIMGGRGTFRDGSTRAQMDGLRAATLKLFPQLAGVDWTHSWGGNVAVTADHFPHLHELAPGIAAALGYNGRGVAMATALGRELARWAKGRDMADLDFPVTPLRPLPFPALHQLAASAEIFRMRVMDRLGL